MDETSINIEETLTTLSFISKEDIVAALRFMADRLRDGIELTEAISDTANKFCSNNIEEFKNIICKMLPDAMIEDEVKKENQNLFNKINAEEKHKESKFSNTQITSLQSIVKNMVTSGITDIDAISLHIKGNLKNEASKEDIYKVIAKMVIPYLEEEEL